MSTASVGWRRVQQVTGGAIRPGGLELTERALAFCSLPAGARVLDVGCGPGATLEYLIQHGFAAIGVDRSTELLPPAPEQDVGGLLVRAMGERLPLASASIDAILVECTLSIMENTDRALAEFSRLLRPGGKLVLSDLYLRQPAGSPALHRLPLTGCLAGAFSRQELALRLGALGFHMLLWEDHSAALRQLAAQLIMADVAPEQIWCRDDCAEPGAGPNEIRQALSAARPGYFLLIAEH